jgi:hypothetical protein
MRRMLAMKEALPDWQFLRDILSSGLLDLDLVFDYRESAIANAVRSNDEILVAVRGQPLSESGFGLLAFERIEKLVSKDWKISVWDNKAEGYEPGGAPTTFSKMILLDSRRYAKYWHVQADLRGIRKWIIANASPQGRRVENTFRRGRSPKYKWDIIRTETFRILGERGEPDIGIPGWDVQERFVEKLMEFSVDKFGEDKGPQRSALSAKLPNWRAEWRKQKQASSN